MALKIRLADIGAERGLLVDRLSRYLSPRADAARYDWLYRANPHGPARAWVAIDEGSGEVVGVASAFPRRAVVDGKETTGWVLGDFCIATEFRALGPAVQLNRACLEAVDAGEAAFCYDFPSKSMMAVYRRLRVKPLGQSIRFVKVLRWGRKLGEIIPIPGARAIGALVDFWPPRGVRTHTSLAVSLQRARCDSSFDALEQTRRGRFRIELDRSADYLNWRYLAHPIERYEILTARDSTTLRGFAVFRHDQSQATIADISVRNAETATILLNHLATLLRRRSIASISVSLLSSHFLVPILRRNGFRPREESPVVFRSGPSLRLPAISDSDFPLTHGDRES